MPPRSRGNFPGGGDGQRAVVVQGEQPAGGEGLEPVVGAAQAAQVRAVGRAAAGVGGDVVQVGPADALPAGGEPAAPVAGGEEGPLPVGGCVGTGGRGLPEHRATAGSVGVGGTAAAGDPGQLGGGGGGQQLPIRAGDREGQGVP